ncbi:CsbD family protein [Betaproteobacteria bacterium]|nr:CsbD family protein [Betaproteobacteria bacterium]
MNIDIAEGHWKQLKGNLKIQWGRLTNDSLDVIAGKREALEGSQQEINGISKEQTEEQIKGIKNRH